jgi:Family of unknown function (DUF6502)
MKRQVRKCARRVLAPLLHVLTAAGLSEQELATVCRQVAHSLPVRSTTRHLAGLREHRYLEHVIAKWNNDPHYLGEGQPIVLKLKGKRPSFTSLVRGVSSRASAATTLRLLSERGLVKVDRAGRARLLARFYPVRAHESLDLELFTTMTVDFLRAHEFNYLRNPRYGSGLFQRIAHNRNSDARIAPEFNRYVRDQGQLFLERIDEWLSRHQPKKSTRSRTRVRLGIGMYVINESLH